MRPSDRRRGFTLVEVSTALLVLTVALRAGVDAKPDPESLEFLGGLDIRVERPPSSFDGLDAVRVIVRWGRDPDHRREVRLDTLIARREP